MFVCMLCMLCMCLRVYFVMRLRVVVHFNGALAPHAVPQGNQTLAFVVDLAPNTVPLVSHVMFFFFLCVCVCVCALFTF